MVLPSRGQLPGVALIVVGIAVVAVSFVVVPYPGVAEYEHEVSKVDEPTVDDVTPVTPFDRLSPEAQAAFRAAVGGDGRHTAYGDANRPPEWQYSDDVGYYLVRYQGETYQVTTWADSFQFFDYLSVSVLLVPGVAMVAGGVMWIQDTGLARYRRPAVAGGAVAFLVGSGAFLTLFLGIDSLVVTVGTLLLCLGALAMFLRSRR